MSGKGNLRRGAGPFPAGSHDPNSSSRSASLPVLLPELRNPDENGLTRSWKIVLSMMFTLTFLLVGLRNHQWLKEAEFPQKYRRLHAIVAEYGTRVYNYQARLRMPREQLELLKRESQALENNCREILLLMEQMDMLRALLRDVKGGTDRDSGRDPGRVPQGQDVTEEPDEEMFNLVHHILKKLREDQVQMVDYALKSAGASIVESETSESYTNNKTKLYWHGIGLLSHEMPPDIILQPDIHPGKCWAFPGSQGHILIRLARKIIPMLVTMEHISEKVSPSRDTSSAPKEFSVHGLQKRCGGEEIFLGQFLYNNTGSTIQTFDLQHGISESLLCVRLKILSNWGHPSYTCVYRFRVHGVPSDLT
ncbi:SUN domain-containing protein 3 isoform X2 [Fukomys damarensis]|uniref:SUN domain-containing protein 3 isoform X2 n=1 Tax=Fukomys damarensis TaxID=885580 RepID=UPI00053FDF4A|nr:SUN domain-containing protein 3 isoform X2 [Fukomys damarensis]